MSGDLRPLLGRMLLAVLIVSALSSGLVAADTEPASAARDRATAEIRQFLRRRVERLQQLEPAAQGDSAAWQSQRAALREQLFEMLGLSPRPPRGDLHATVTGQIERDGIVVEKLHFQSVPGLYVTANFYRPREVNAALPTILYLNGHARNAADGVSFGNKVSYQHHGTWFAKNGYCCLSIDTLQLGEIEGVHHGTYRLGMNWWIARGYTPAGVEAWNSIRALDYLATRSEVDPARIGVTGRSGGGAYTWWVAALDDRPACLVPVAGITDLENHVVDDCAYGHCDCMYHLNQYGWDFGTIAALAAPRPCLLANTDKDLIFPLDGIERIHARMRQVYEGAGAADRLGLFVCEGPHADTQELQVAAFRWMNRWLKGTDAAIVALGEKPFTPQELRVFEQLPADERNTSIHETFVPLAKVSMPTSLADWNQQQAALTEGLVRQCFSARSDSRGLPDGAQAPAKLVADRTSGSLRLRTIEFPSEENLRLQVYVVSAADSQPVLRATLEVADDAGWQRFVDRCRGAFPELAANVAPNGAGPTDEVSLESGQAVACIVPRGWGPHAWSTNPRFVTHLPRQHVLVGTTIDVGRIWDVRRALQTLGEQVWGSAEVEMQGTGAAAGIALYAGLLEPVVRRFELTDLPASHREGPSLLGVLRVLDLPQAVALAFPRPVALHTREPEAWQWTLQVAQLYGAKPPFQVNKTATR